MPQFGYGDEAFKTPIEYFEKHDTLENIEWAKELTSKKALNLHRIL